MFILVFTRWSGVPIYEGKSRRKEKKREQRKKKRRVIAT